jgi:hypothetical protein
MFTVVFLIVGRTWWDHGGGTPPVVDIAALDIAQVMSSAEHFSIIVNGRLDLSKCDQIKSWVPDNYQIFIFVHEQKGMDGGDRIR